MIKKYIKELFRIIKFYDAQPLMLFWSVSDILNNKIIKSEEHVDQDFKCKVALYYINDNNGYTIIGDKKVESKSNRMVLFNSNQKHCGTNSTNCNNRMVINFNYF